MEVAGGARQSTRCRSTGPVRDVGRGLGCQFLFIKIGLEGLSPPQVVLGRLLTGSAALVTASLVSGQRPPREPTVWAHLAMMSVLLHMASFLFCLLYTSDAADDLLCVDLG